MTKDERQQSLANARRACEWLKYHLVHTPQEPLLPPIEQLIAGFEILDEKELRQAEAGREFGHLGKEHGKKGGRPKKST